jgi:soluble lytic murein transglycosylase-like protein
MRTICCHSSAPPSSRRPSIFSSRPDLKAATRLSRRQSEGHACAKTWSTACPQLVRTIARIIVVAVPIASPIPPFTFFDGAAWGQNASREEPADRFAAFIAEASDRFAIPARLIRAVMKIESGSEQRATSPRGALGLMQIMPGTWVELSARYGLGLDPFDARDNILAGTAYLKEMHDRFGSAGFLAAYHAGPRRYEQHLVTGKPLPSETTAYVAAVTPLLDNEQGERAGVGGRRALPWQEAPLFVERAGAP